MINRYLTKLFVSIIITFALFFPDANAGVPTSIINSGVYHQLRSYRQDSLYRTKGINNINDFANVEDGSVDHVLKKVYLAPWYEFKLNSDIDTDYTFIPPDEGFLIMSANMGSLIYSGTGSLFESSTMGAAFLFADISIYSYGSGTCFTISGSSDGIILLVNSEIIDFSTVAVIRDGVFDLFFCNIFGFDNGIDIKDSPEIVMSQSRFSLGNNTGGTFFTIDSTPTTGGNGSIQLNNNFFEPGTSETVFDIKSTSEELGGTVVGSTWNQTGTLFASGSKDYKNINYKFAANKGITESAVKGNIYFTSNATETVIDQVDVPIKVKASSYESASLERLTFSNDSLVVTGLEPVAKIFTGILTLKPVLGTNIELKAYIAKTDAETYAVTFTNATNLVNIVGHGLSNGTSIRFSTTGTLPAEIRDDQFYYVINATADTFQISNTSGGAAHTFTDDGTGTHYYSLGRVIEASKAVTTPSSTRSFSVPITAIIEITTGDIIEVFVDNHDTTSNIIVESLSLLTASAKDWINENTPDIYYENELLLAA